MTYDATVLKAAKADPPAEHWTWTECADYAAKLTRTLGGKVYGVSDGGGDDLGAFQIFLRQRRKDLFTPDGALGYAEQDLEEWLSYWDEMRRRGAAPPGDVTSAARNDAAKNPLIQGQVAMTFGSGLEISLPTLTSHELDFVPVPAGPAGSAEGQDLSGGVLLTPSPQRAGDGGRGDHELPRQRRGGDQDHGTDPGDPADREGPPARRHAPRPGPTARADGDQRRGRPRDRRQDHGAAVPAKGAGQVKELLFQNNLAVAFKRKTVPVAVKSFFAGAMSALS